MVKYVDIKDVINLVKDDWINGVNHGKRIILMMREKWTAVSSGIGVGKVCRVENIVLEDLRAQPYTSARLQKNLHPAWGRWDASARRIYLKFR